MPLTRASLTTPALAVALLGACAHASAESEVVDRIIEREGAAVDLEREPDDAVTLPPGVELGDGLGRDEAVAIALWSSPSLRAELTRAEAAEGELAGAKRPTNPTLRLLFPVGGGASFSGLLTWPIETLATMPGRIAVARRQLATTELALVQTSLDLARDVRLAHADWVLAHERLELREEMATQSAELLAIVTAQAELGELSQLDRETARAVAATAVDELERARTDVTLAESRLRTRLGWGLDAPFSGELKVQDEPLANLPGTPLAELERVGESRPAFELAQLDVNRARTQLELERAAMVGVAAVGQTSGPKLQFGPQLVLPNLRSEPGRPGPGPGRARRGPLATTCPARAGHRGGPRGPRPVRAGHGLAAPLRGRDRRQPSARARGRHRLLRARRTRLRAGAAGRRSARRHAPAPGRARGRGPSRPRRSRARVGGSAQRWARHQARGFECRAVIGPWGWCWGCSRWCRPVAQMDRRRRSRAKRR